MSWDWYPMASGLRKALDYWQPLDDDFSQLCSMLAARVSCCEWLGLSGFEGVRCEATQPRELAEVPTCRACSKGSANIFLGVSQN